MQSPLGVLRAQYLSAILIPLLLAAIVTGTTVLSVLPLVAGWTLLAVAANLLNDYFDGDRAMPVDRTGLLLLYAVATVLGAALLIEVPVLAAAFIALSAGYNRWFTDGIGGAVLNAVTFFVLPPLSLGAGPGTVAMTGLLGFSIDLIHLACDDEHRLGDRQLLLGFGVAALGGAALVIRTVAAAPRLSYLLPFALYFLAAPFVLREYRNQAGKPTLVAAGMLATIYLVGVAAATGTLV